MLYRAVCGECGCVQFVLEQDTDNKVHIICDACETEFATTSNYNLEKPKSGEQHEDDKDSD